MGRWGDGHLQDAARPQHPPPIRILGCARQAGLCSWEARGCHTLPTPTPASRGRGGAVRHVGRSRCRRGLSLSQLRQPSCSCRVLVLEDPPRCRWDPRRARHPTASGRCARSPPALPFRHPPSARAATSAVARRVGAEAAGPACRLRAAQLGVGTWGKVPSTIARSGGTGPGSGLAGPVPGGSSPPCPITHYPQQQCQTLWALYLLSVVISFAPSNLRIGKLRLAPGPQPLGPELGCSALHFLMAVFVYKSTLVLRQPILITSLRWWLISGHSVNTVGEWRFQLPFPRSFSISSVVLWKSGNISYQLLSIRR